jgi:hypothetical protein
MPPLKVPLRPQERDALQKLAAAERRNPPAQAAEIIAAELQRRGLLPAEHKAVPAQAAQL